MRTVETRQECPQLTRDLKLPHRRQILQRRGERIRAAPEDLRAALTRELDRVRSSWLDGIAKVVTAPMGAEVCVFVKTKEPKIEWHVARRNGEQLMEFLSRAGYLAREIAAGQFYKRPGKWCGWCDYLPVCVKDDKRTKESLVQVSQ